MIPDLSHAPYVWTSYSIFAAIVAWQFIQPLIRRKRLVDSMIEAEAERRAARRNQQ
ncbi:MAG: heme exporter protein CcmD [Wenzhouxiangellaceae bacterium]